MSGRGAQKRQATAKNLAKDAAAAEKAPTGLLSLSDDLLGHVYACLNDTNSKRSFRHAHSLLYKSPAINAQIVACAVNGETTPAHALACFPRYATLKEVRFAPPLPPLPNGQTEEGQTEESGADDEQPTLATLLGEALRLDPSCLLEVRTIHINGWTRLDAFAAAALLVLFPQLSKGSAKVDLHLHDSDVDVAFLEVLGSRAKGLQRLHWTALCNDVLVMADTLSCFRGLQELSLSDVPQIYGLGELLQALPHLHTLVLRYTTTVPGAPVASRSLKHLVLDIAFLQLDRSVLPALQLLELHSLDLNDLLPFEEADALIEDSEAQSKVLTERLEKLAVALSDFPLKLSDDDGKFRFVLRSRAIHLLPSMLQALAPLRPIFCRDVRALEVEGLLLDAGSLAELCSLCENLTSLTVDQGDGSEVAAYTDDHGLLLLVTSLKHLRHAHLRIDFPLRDMLAAMLVIAQGLRAGDFSLSLRPTSAECHQLLSRTMEMWDCAKHLLPSVTIHVQ